MKNLIEKYFEGQTTLEEEDKLKAYFNSGNVSDDVKQYAPLFQFFKHEKSLELGADFDERLFEKLEIAEEAKVVPMRNRRPMLFSIAAALAILLAAFLLLKPDQTTAIEHTVVDWSKYEITDEKLALEETQKALRLLGSKLNRGTEKTIEEVSKTKSVAKYLN